MEGHHDNVDENPYVEEQNNQEQQWDSLKEKVHFAGDEHPSEESTEKTDTPTKPFDEETLAGFYKQQQLDNNPNNYTVKPGQLEDEAARFGKTTSEDLSKVPLTAESILNSGMTTEEIIERIEFMDFKGKAIFSDIDGTITDNEGNLNMDAVNIIKAFMKAGGTFIPVTGRARYESVKDLVDALGVPHIIINNGAEIFNNKGERVFGSEIPDNQYRATFEAVNAKEDAIWMQNKRDPKTSEEWLYTNGTPETDQAMLDVGIVDNVQNEEGRIGLKAKHVESSEVMDIPGQNYKIQIMSPNPDTIKDLYNHFKSLDIPCMLNMQSKKDGEYHWVEVIVGTKISGIQKYINDLAPGEITSAAVVGDGGNDLTMFKELRNRNGEPIINTRTAVANASPVVKEAAAEAHEEGLRQKEAGETVTTEGSQLESTYKRLDIKKEGQATYVISGGGAAIAEMIFKLGEQKAAQKDVNNYQTTREQDERRINNVDWREAVRKQQESATPDKSSGEVAA